VCSVLGGCVGYFIGFALWQPVGAPLLRQLHFLTPEARTVVVRRIDGDAVTVTAEDGSEKSYDRYRLHANPPVGSPPVGDRAYEIQQTQKARLAVGQTAYLMTDKYHLAQAWYDRYGVWVVFIAAFTPVPYIVFSSVSGLAHLSFVAFVLTSIVGRSARFFLVGGLIYAFGRPIRTFIDKYFNLLTIAFVVLLIAGFAVIPLFY